MRALTPAHDEPPQVASGPPHPRRPPNLTNTKRRKNDYVASVRVLGRRVKQGGVERVVSQPTGEGNMGTGQQGGSGEAWGQGRKPERGPWGRSTAESTVRTRGAVQMDAGQGDQHGPTAC